MKKLYWLVYPLALFSVQVFAQVTGDYRSRSAAGAGPLAWATAANWEVFNSGSWATAVAAPTATNTTASNTITILATQTISINANIAGTVLAAVVVNGNGTLTDNGNRTFTLSGNLTNNGTINPIGGTWTFSGTFANTGTISSSGGTIVLSGAGPSSLNGIAQTFSALTISSVAAVTANAPFITNGALTVSGTATFTDASTNGTIAGNLAVTSTATSAFTSNTLTTFGGATTISGTGARTFADVKITAALSVAANVSSTINGNLENDGTVNCTNGTWVFAGSTPQMILNTSGTPTTQFFNLTVSSGSSVTVDVSIPSFQIAGTSLAATGTFTSNADVTFSRAGTTALTGTGATFNNTVSVTSGTTLNGAGSLSMNGSQLANDGTITSTGAVTFGSATGTTLSTTAAPKTFSFATIVLNQNVTLGSGITLTSTAASPNPGLTLNSGTLALGGGILTVGTGQISVTSGVIDATVASTVTIGATGAVAGTVAFTPGSSLTSFTVSRSIAIQNDITVTALTLNTAGTVVTQSSGTFTIANNGSITSTGGTLSLASQIIAAGVYDLSYTIATALTTGDELSSSSTAINNFTKAGTQVLTLNKDLTVNNTFTLSAGTLTASGNAVTLNGASSMISGTAVSNFAVLNVNGPLTKSSTGATTVTGNVVVGTGTNTGSITFTAGTTIFSGTTLITNSGSGSISFFTVTASTTANALTTSADLTIAGVLTVTSPGTFTANAGADVTLANNLAGTGAFTSNALVTFNGTTTISNTGTKTFTDVTVSGTVNVTANITSTVNGNLENDGIINCTNGTWVFAGSTKTISGTSPTTNLFNLTINGTLTNNVTVTVGSNLTGTGALTQGTGSMLNIGGTSTITTLTATATGNTVNYSGAVQTVHTGNYYHLTLSGSGSKTLNAATTSIGGNFTLSGTATTTATAALTIGANVYLGSGTTFTGGAFTHNVGGDWTNDGSTFTSTGTITLSGTSQNIGGLASMAFNNLTLSGGTKAFAASTTTIGGTLAISSGAIADLSSSNTYSANALTLGGAAVSSGPWGSTASGVLHTNDTYFTGNGFITITTGSFVYYSANNGDWSSSGTWSTTGFGGSNLGTFPAAGDAVQIGGGNAITVTGGESCLTLTYESGSSNTNTVAISSGNSLTVNGAITIPQSSTGGSNVLDVGAGSLNAASLSLTSGGSVGGNVTIGSGTADVSGNVASTSAINGIQFTGAGLLQLGGAFYTTANGTLTSFSGGVGSTVEYNGLAGQTVQAFTYQNLTLSGSGNKTIGAITLTVAGTTIVNGTLAISSATGTKTFGGLVTVNTGGVWDNTAANEAVTFQGGISNSGTFKSGTGLYTFNTNPQALTGTLSIQTITVTGVELTNNNALTVATSLTLTTGTGASLVNNGALGIGTTLTVNDGTVTNNTTGSITTGTTVAANSGTIANDGSITIGTNLTGTGTGALTQGTGSMLNIGGTSTITTLTATATGNTVNYSGAVQTVHTGNYYHLTLSGSGSKTLNAATTSIGGNFTLSGTATTTATAALTIGGNVYLGSGTTFTGGAFTHNVGGDWTNDGSTFTSTGTIILSGAAQNINGSATTIFNNLTLSGGTKAFAASTTTIGGTLAISSGAIANLSSSNTYSANALTLGGAAVSSGPWGSTASGVLHTNDTYFTGNGFITITTGSFVYYSANNGDWSSSGTWSTTGFGGSNLGTFPAAGDAVQIGGGFTVTITAAVSCATLTFDQATTVAANMVSISSGSLTVSGAVTIPRNGSSNVLDAGTGTLTAGSVSFTTGSSGTGTQQLTIATGTATVQGNVSGYTGAGTLVQLTGAGLLQAGGTFFTAAQGTLSAATGSTVEFNGGAQTIPVFTYGNLTLSGASANTKILAGTTTVQGLTIGANTTLTANQTLTVNGTTTVNGTLLFTNNTGTKTFVGPVVVSSTGSWSNVNEGFTFQGGLTNNGGTFTGGTSGTYLFNFLNTNPQVLAGTLTIPTVTVTGVGLNLTAPSSLTVSGTLTLTNNSVGAAITNDGTLTAGTIAANNRTITNNGTLTASTALTGTGGTLTQGTNATLNIGGTSTITNLLATTNVNTVNYTGASQTIYSGNYYNLTLSGTGSNSLPVGTTSITGNLILNSSSPSLSTGVNGALTIGGSLTIGANNTFNAGTVMHHVAGNWTNDGIFNHNNGTIDFNGAGQSIGGAATSNDFYNLTLDGTASSIKLFSIKATAANNLSITGVKVDWNGLFTHTANALILNGTVQSAGGTWGSVASTATNPTDTYFINTGWVDIATGIQTYYLFVSNNDWNTPGIWSTTGFGGPSVPGIPGGTDFVQIGGNKTVTVGGSASCKSITFDTGTTTTSQLTINGGGLAVSGDININQPSLVGATNILNVSSGSLSTTNINFTNGSTGGTGHKMNIATATTTATATVSGNITSTGTSSSIVFVGAGLLQVAGAMYAPTNGSITKGTGSIEYNGTNQTIQTFNYQNLIASGSGTKTFSVATTTVSGNLSVDKGATLNVGGLTLNVVGTTTIGEALGASSGTIAFVTSNAGNKTFQGAVTVNSLGTWNNAINESPFFRGGITNNGAVGNFIAGTGIHTFNTSATQSIGTGTLLIQNVTVTSPTVLTNNGTFTIGTSLTGTGGLTQGTAGILNLGGTNTITNFIASTSGNTVNYSGAAQTIFNTNYYNLTLSGSGDKTLAASSAIGGNVDIGSTTRFVVGAVSLSVTGTTSVAGTLSLNAIGGLKTFGGLVTLTSGTWDNTANEAVTFHGGITYNSGTFNAGTGIQTFDTNSQALTGTFAIPSVTVTGVAVALTNNGSLTVNTALAGTGGLTQGASANLNLGGSSTVANMIATANGNTVNYTLNGSQTVNPANYYHLTLSGSGVKTLQIGTTAIGGDFALSGTVSTTGVVGITVSGNVNIGSGTSFASGAFTHNVAGDWNNSGTFTHSNGTVNLNGTSQNVYGTNAFYNLSASGIATLQADNTLANVLTLGSSATFNAGSNLLTLLSTSDTQSASIGSIQSGATFNGSVIVQRFMSAKGSVNRYVSSPVSGTTLSDLVSNFALVNNLAQTYTESVAGSSSNGYSTLGLGSILVSGKGYLVDPTSAYASSPVTWDVTGSLIVGRNQKDVILPVTYTNHGLPNDDGYNLVGNPYPSAILWDSVASVGGRWNRGGIDPVISVPDLGITTGYPTYYHTRNYVDGSGDLPGGVIALGQAFWVHATRANPKVIVHEAAKNTASSGTFYRTEPISQSSQLIIAINNGKMEDRSFLKLNKDATPDFDSYFDGYKLKNSEMNIFLLDDANRNLVMHTLSSISEDAKIRLGVEVDLAGSYEITFSNVENFGLSDNLYLIDKYRHTAVEIDSNVKYAFTVSDPNSSLIDRFYISKNSLIADNSGEIVEAFPNPVKDFLSVNSLYIEDENTSTLFDINGKVLDTRVWTEKTSIDMRDLSSGIYILRVNSAHGYNAKKIFKE